MKWQEDGENKQLHSSYTFFTKYYQDDKMKDNEMNRTVPRIVLKCQTNILSETLKARYKLEELGIGYRIKQELKEDWCDGVDWIHLAEDNLLILNKATNLPIPQMAEKFLSIRLSRRTTVPVVFMTGPPLMTSWTTNTTFQVTQLQTQLHENCLWTTVESFQTIHEYAILYQRQKFKIRTRRLRDH